MMSETDTRDEREQLAEMTRELEALRRWKNEAMLVLGEWDEVWEWAGRPGLLGSSKSASVTRYILDLRRAAGHDV